MFDFKKLERPRRAGAPADPIEIFRSRPSGKDGAKELWQGQAKALTDWYKDPSSSTLISMYTGSGKTIVGCLIAQSYLNQGTSNVVYACPTIDLILQTEREARRIGLRPTTYHSQHFSDENFEQGKSFCITTYQALLTSRSRFRGQLRPGAIIFDDAHVGERLVRDALTLVVSRENHREGYEKLVARLRAAFTELNLQHSLEAAVAEESAGSIVLVPPSVALKQKEAIEEALAPLIDKNDAEMFLPYDYLRGKLHLCAVTISRAKVEFTPPFLPSLLLRALEDNQIPRVYLSATIQSKGDIARAFGRLPKRTVEPEVDAGRGERLVMFGSKMPDVVSSPEVIRSIGNKHKVLVSLPSGRVAKKWEPIVRPPERKEFSRVLDAFRKADRGFFCSCGQIRWNRPAGRSLPCDDD